MVTISADAKVLSILEKFIQGQYDETLRQFDLLDENDLHFSVKFDKYECCINAPAAKVIIDFQNSIYKIAALLSKGKSDIRYLTSSERDKLEIPFKIIKSSTIEEASDLLKRIKELLNMIPEKHRVVALVATLLIIFGYLSWDQYLEYKEKTEIPKTFEAAMVKIADQNIALTKIVSDHEKSLLRNLSEIDKNVEYQGNNYTNEELKSVKKEKYPKNGSKEILSIKGVFTISDINIKEGYLIVEENSSTEPIRIYYSTEDLLAQMMRIKEHLKDAIDNESKRFYIEASVVKKNNKVDTRVLTKIEESSRDIAHD